MERIGKPHTITDWAAGRSGVAGPLVGRANLALGRGRLCPQRSQMIGRFPFSGHVANDGAILLDRLFERGQVPTEGGIDCLRAEPPKCLATERGILELSRLHAVVASDERVDRVLPILSRSREQIDPERLVGLPGHILGRPCPEILVRDRRDVTECLPMPLGFVQSTLGDHRPGRAAAAAFGDVGGERRDAGRAARERVDMLVRRDALRRVDRQRMTQPNQQPAGLTVREPAPFDLGIAPSLVRS